MAYVYDINKAVNNITEFNVALYGLLLAAGWELYDTYSNYQILRSEGEVSNGKPVYIKIFNDNNGYLHVHTNWDSSTHLAAGITTLGSSAFNIATGRKFFGYASKDGFMLFVYSGSTQESKFFLGKVSHPDEFSVTLSAQVTAGTDKVLTVSDTTQFNVGAAYQLFDRSQCKYGKFTVTAKDASTITVNKITTTYNIGSDIGILPMPWVRNEGYAGALASFCSGSESYAEINANVGYTAVGTALINGTYSSEPILHEFMAAYGETVGARRILPVRFLTLHYWSSTVTQKHVTLYGTSALLKHCLTTSTNYGMPLTPGVATSGLDVFIENQLDSGTSTGSNDSTHFNDTSKSWTTDQWANKTLVMTSGVESGQCVKIISNTATQLVTATMTVIPSTPTYSICDKAYRLFDGFATSYEQLYMQEGV